MARIIVDDMYLLIVMRPVLILWHENTYEPLYLNFNKLPCHNFLVNIDVQYKNYVVCISEILCK